MFNFYILSLFLNISSPNLPLLLYIRDTVEMEMILGKNYNNLQMIVRFDDEENILNLD